MGIDATPISWDCCSQNFLDNFLPRELTKEKVQQFINLRKGNMTFQEYGLKFIQLSKYALHIILDSKAQMNNFLYGESNLVKT